ncbi:hypothetical protein [Parendozoicomonas sp. Alg238-R29]|uniref:hypothetical protein n=1 Tax=Parendozoicomonas sp. Alg238-R29 TaxID=2993446 RepID=UPI00248DC7BA|nr:hypothetical protein [Parendozoicomonas sp. Alg238-R29]
MLSRSESIQHPFADPLRVSTPEAATAENTSPVQRLSNVEPMTRKSDNSDVPAFKKQKLLDDYKITWKKKVKLFLKHTYRGAVKGAKIGGITGLIGGTVTAAFSMHIAAIPAGVIVGLAAGTGIGGTVGAIKGIRTIRSLTPQTLLQDKINDAAANVKKAQIAYTKAANRTDGLFLKAQKNMGFGVDYLQPTLLTHTSGLEEHLEKNITAMSALENPSKRDKSKLKALQSLKKQLDKMNSLLDNLKQVKIVENNLRKDLALISEKVNADTPISETDSTA